MQAQHAAALLASTLMTAPAAVWKGARKALKTSTLGLKVFFFGLMVSLEDIGCWGRIFMCSCVYVKQQDAL